MVFQLVSSPEKAAESAIIISFSNYPREAHVQGENFLATLTKRLCSRLPIRSERLQPFDLAGAAVYLACELHPQLLIRKLDLLSTVAVLVSCHLLSRLPIGSKQCLLLWRRNRYRSWKTQSLVIRPVQFKLWYWEEGMSFPVEVQFLPGKKDQNSLNKLKILVHENNNLVCDMLSEPAFENAWDLRFWGSTDPQNNPQKKRIFFQHVEGACRGQRNKWKLGEHAGHVFLKDLIRLWRRNLRTRSHRDGRWTWSRCNVPW